MATAIVRSIFRYWLWYAVVLAGLAVLVLTPGGFSEKSRALLHGLCAQTPTHSFRLGDALLPFDSRMTGIYGGTLVTLLYMASRRRFFGWGLPPRRVTVVLVFFVLAMAADGFNSLFTDLGIPHPWSPRNELRLLTGYISGIALAAVLSWLLGSALYRLGNPESSIRDVRDLVFVLVPLVPFAGLLLHGAGWLYLPVALMLVVSAWLTTSVLALAIIVLAFRLDDRVERLQSLHLPGAVAVLLGMAIMLALAFGRVWLERSLGIPSTL